MKNLIYITILFLIAVGATSCGDTEFEIAGNKSWLVVQGQISTDTTSHCIKLSRTYSIDSTKAPIVHGAKVTITDDNFSTITLWESNGKYYTPPTYFGLANHTYTLNIEISENGTTEHYTAQSTMPEPLMQIDSARQTIDTINSIQTFKLYGKDDGNIQNYYLFSVADDWFGYRSYYELNTNFMSDEAINGKAFALNVLKTCLIDPTVTGLNVYSITKEFYDFLKIAKQESDIGFNLITSGQPENLPSNINGSRKAFGYFTAVNKSRVAVK